ncbi:unnamed protein product [Brassica rapa]|uniref:Uncharacterized protein n=1 Tax=Brassica campestris TaxID=3711 RepID=A0A3P6BNH9_BRACM|nr:unnamed protein product [Brassica rapa]VDD07687.1 unnamed protein product [Brassica rapa]
MLPSSPPSSPSWSVGDVSQSLVLSYTFCGSVYSAVYESGNQGKHLAAGGGSKTQEVVMLPLSFNRLRGRAVSVCPART